MNDENSPLGRQEMDILGRVVWRYTHEEGGQQKGGGGFGTEGIREM